MTDESIKLVNYDPIWTEKFELEKDFLHGLLDPFIKGSIEHIGSTAVIGMVAKPIIDIMVGVESLQASKKAISILTANSYCYYPYKADVMHWFCKPQPEFRTHHLHLVPFNSPLWIERLTFRDLLINNNDVALEYAELKRRLAAQYQDDREAYTQQKWPFIQSCLASTNNKSS